MKQIDCSTFFLPFLCKKVDYIPTISAQCITCLENNVPIAGVIYDNYNGQSICAHIWVDKDVTPSRDWYAAIFDYPFDRLGVYKIVGQVSTLNTPAAALDTHFGFVEEARIEGFFEDGDMIFYTMTRAQCRVLNSPLWVRVCDKVRAA